MSELHPQPQSNDKATSRGTTGATGATSTSLSGDFPPPIATSELPILTPITTPLAASAITPFGPPSDRRDEVDRETAIEADASITINLDSDVRGRGPDDYAIESLAASIMEDIAEATTETFYVGDQQGIGYILDIVGEPGVISQHYGLPYMVARHHLTPQDVAYIRSKGVFSVPSEPVCEALLTAYFYHIHPILPVVDAAAVLTSFRNGGASAVNLLLLWSMFSVAANCLYDNGYEEDRISIIQSVSLLAFWCSDLGERAESWHWMGIAISLSQTLGLNRDPDRGHRNTRLSDRQRRLWRRIWWSCFFRDRWLSLAMGRPMRINIRDCDTPMTSAEDLANDFSELPSLIRARYMPSDFRQLADHAATIALWRPYSNRVATGIPLDQEGAWCALVHQKIQTAAANTTTLLDKVISEQLIGYIGPMTYVQRPLLAFRGP
ncbi:hypothetical protein DL765_010903 [Monosporascus sp. GIB2]|nr:hypothetical protein DL765_010903 [Monosporascus sp. GIB2]